MTLFNPRFDVGVLPASGVGRIDYRLTYLLGFERIFKGGMAWLTCFKTLQEIRGLMHEGVFVTDR